MVIGTGSAVLDWLGDVAAPLAALRPPWVPLLCCTMAVAPALKPVAAMAINGTTRRARDQRRVGRIFDQILVIVLTPKRPAVAGGASGEADRDVAGSATYHDPPPWGAGEPPKVSGPLTPGRNDRPH